MTSLFQLGDIKGQKGAYILQIHVGVSQHISIKSLGEFTLAPGHYFYCGSAFGPGGMVSRVKRHIKRDKKAHWHIDRLTIAHGVEKVAFFEQESECVLLAQFLARDGFHVPIKDFGSSDCPRCASHFVKSEQAFDLEELGATVPIFVPAL